VGEQSAQDEPGNRGAHKNGGRGKQVEEFHEEIMNYEL
jgi:hypothetical protein